VTRLLQILIAETSHLIWVIRCNKGINNHDYMQQQIEARWIKIINNPLTTDRITATKINWGKKYNKLIDETWKCTLQKQNIPYQNWLQSQEVFSG